MIQSIVKSIFAQFKIYIKHDRVKNSTLLRKLIAAGDSIEIRRRNAGGLCDTIYQLTARSNGSIGWLFRHSLYDTNYRFRRGGKNTEPLFRRFARMQLKRPTTPRKTVSEFQSGLASAATRRMPLATELLPQVLQIVNFFLKFHSDDAR